MHSSNVEKPSLEVSRVSAVPVEDLKEDVIQSFTQIYPDVSVINLAENVSVDGINYSKRMIIAHGSVGGLPEFAEIVQICVLKESLEFIVKKITVMVQWNATTGRSSLTHYNQVFLWLS